MAIANEIKKIKRHLIQLVSTIIYNANLNGFINNTIYRGEIKKICVPGLNCFSCPGAYASCPMGALQNALYAGKYKNNVFAKIPFYIVGILLLFGLIFGRIICGFLCPFGFLQDLLYKIKTRKINKNKITKKLIYVKYIILVLFVLMLPLLFNTPAFCKFICPVGTLEAGIYFVFITKAFASVAKLIFKIKFIILVFILLISVIIFRPFCRFLCPLGAIYGLFNKISPFTVKIDTNSCINCNKCVNFCKMDIKKVGDQECINCNECKILCTNGSIYRIKNK